MTTNPSPEPAPKAWARRHLESTAAAPDRAAFLRNLREENFVPSWRWQQAALVHLDIPRTGLDQSAIVVRHGDAALEEEQRLRTEIKAFATEFFSIDVATRQQRFDQLMGTCAFSPPLQFRLQALSPGLNSTGQVKAGPDVLELAENIRELFVLQPVDRVRRRRALLEEMMKDCERWQNAARTIHREAPAIVALSPELFAEATNLKRTKKRRIKAADKLLKSRSELARKADGLDRLIMAFVFVYCGILLYFVTQQPGFTSKPPIVPEGIQFPEASLQREIEKSLEKLPKMPGKSKDKNHKKQTDGGRPPADPPRDLGVPKND